MMRLGISCSWCDSLCWWDEPSWPYCSNCNHRADAPRCQCDCLACVRAVLPDLLLIADDPYPELPPELPEGGDS